MSLFGGLIFVVFVVIAFLLGKSIGVKQGKKQK